MKGFLTFISLLIFSQDPPPENIVTSVMTLYKIEGKNLFFEELKIPFPLSESFTELVKKKKVMFESEEIKEIKLPSKVEICYELPLLTEEGYSPVKVIYIKFLE